jgi:uncharacterized cupin superfamily protein
MSRLIIQKLTENQISELKIRDWPIWEKEVSRFDWHYDDDEECLILEGEFDAETPEGIFAIHPGDFVTFKSGLSCVWNVKKPIRKHYRFP